MSFRAAYGYDKKAASDAAGIDMTGQESLTIQSMAEDADINTIMKRFGVTGRMPVNPRVPMYGDFSGIKDYQSALNAVGAAYDDFMLLPASVRKRFDNNPQKLLEFVSDDANIDEARKLGLLKVKENFDESRGTSSGSGRANTEAGGETVSELREGKVGAGSRREASGGRSEATGGSSEK